MKPPVRTATLLAILCLLLAAPAIAPARADTYGDDMRRAATLHRSGDTARALAIWRHHATAGSPDAAYNLGLVHYYGDGVAVDFAQALTWFRSAAERGDRSAQFHVGLIYQRGDGVAADENEAHRWFVMHRTAHHHHVHDEQMQRWRQQAAALIWARDMRETVAATPRNDAQVLADLRRRAGLLPQPSIAQLAR